MVLAFEEERDPAIEVAHSNVILSSMESTSQFAAYKGSRIKNVQGKWFSYAHRYSAPHPLTKDILMVHIRVNW